MTEGVLTQSGIFVGQHRMANAIHRHGRGSLLQTQCLPYVMLVGQLGCFPEFAKGLAGGIIIIRCHT